MHTNHQLFSKIIAISTISDYYKLFDINVSEFWKTHYSFTSPSNKSAKKLTKSFIDLLLINTIIPLKYLYLKSIDKFNETEVIDIIKQLKPEKNSIIDKFSKLKVVAKSALETQALLQLKNEYCTHQRCLSCIVGDNLIGKQI